MTAISPDRVVPAAAVRDTPCTHCTLVVPAGLVVAGATLVLAPKVTKK